MICAERPKASSRPTLLVSRCLNQDNCRYNAEILEDKILQNVKPYCDFKFVCPEVEIGMPTPRPPIRILAQGSNLELIQPHSGSSFYESMVHFSRRRLDELENIDGFIMKARSPSCGVFDTPYYTSIDGPKFSSRGSGIFTSQALQHFPELPFIDEDHLLEKKYAKVFFTVCFAAAKLRDLSVSLLDFHEEYKPLLNQGKPSSILTLERYLHADCRDSYKSMALRLIKMNQANVLSANSAKRSIDSSLQMDTLNRFPVALEELWN